MDNLILPPLLNAVISQQPFDQAIDQVRHRRAGAGDLFWSPDKLTSNMAIILEPEVAANQALEMVPLAMVALGDCLGVLVPPQVAVQFRYPLRVVVNAGVTGEISAAIAATGNDNDVPDWLVLGIKINLARADDAPDPGEQPDITTLDEEGCEDLTQTKFIETYARHFLSWIASWQDEGFLPIARSWKFKAEDQNDPDMAELRKAVAVYESTI